jgi:hypothetical protein
MSNLPSAYVAHSVGGRTRIRVKRRRGDTRYFETVHDSLGRCDGVTAVETNPLTASILVHHANGLDALARFAEDVKLFSLQRESQANSAELPDGAALTWLVPDAISDPRVLLFIVMTGLGLVQMARGAVMPAAVSLFWYGIGALFLPALLSPPDARTQYVEQRNLASSNGG